MRSIFLFSWIVLFSIVLRAEVPDNYRYLKSWRIIDRFGSVDSLAVDTAHLNFQHRNPIDRFSIANSFNGNLGSPIQSKLFFNRPALGDFMFYNAYFPYLAQIESATFYNTKTPYSNLNYISGGTLYRKEDDLRFIFSANVNKNFNLGATIDYLYAGGEYDGQAVQRFAGSLFGSYTGKRYSASGFLSSNNHSNFENGGVADVSYITSPIGIATKDIPTKLNGYSNFKYNSFFYNHQYTIGVDKSVKGADDSIRTVYVPVTRFIHTIKLEEAHKRYFENEVDTSFYKNTYGVGLQTNDTATYQKITNIFSVGLAEEFNKWMNFGMTAFVENDVQRYAFLENDSLQSVYESSTRVGGILSKQQGRNFKYNVVGEICPLGHSAGDFSLDAHLGGFFKLWNDSISLLANGFVRSDKPSFFYDFYESNHFRWHNHFKSVYRSHVGGTFSIPTKSFSLKVGVENLTDYIYFNNEALPTQYDGSIQVVAANLKQDFHLGKFTLENNLVYQISSQKSILPLPMLSLYHNLYVDMKWFKVLSVQVGTNVRYHSEYYAPAYMPATGQFYNQKDVLIGNFPVVSGYINCHLKRTRFFVEYYHLNQMFMKTAYFSMPNYPLNPALVKIGLSWNFYD